MGDLVRRNPEQGVMLMDQYIERAHTGVKRGRKAEGKRTRQGVGDRSFYSHEYGCSRFQAYRTIYGSSEMD